MVHPAAAALLEAKAWRTLPTSTSTSIRSTTRRWSTDDAGFVAVLDRHGATLRWWAPQHWATPVAACGVISELALVAGRGVSQPCGDHGAELVVGFAGGSIRAASDGSHVRVADPVGETVGDGLAYWTCDDFAAPDATAMSDLLDAAERVL